MTSADPQRSRGAWLAALCGLVLTLALFYPGFMSVDSAVQWAQARSGAYDNAHPVLMALVWSGIETVWPGPGGVFVLHCSLFWLAAGWFAWEVSARTKAQVIWTVVLGLWPPVLGIVAHLWKDVPMTALVLLAVAALMHERRRPSNYVLIAAMAMLALACAYRHNALPLVVPFAWYVSGRRHWSARVVHTPPNAAADPSAVTRRAPCRPAGPVRRAMVTAAMTLLVAIIAMAPDRLPNVTQRTMWPMLALCDLASVSIDIDRMLLPASTRDPRLSLDELRQHYLPYAQISIFDTADGKIPIPSLTQLSPEQLNDLQHAWWRMLIEHPLPYLRHRWRSSALLFGASPGQVPDDMTLWLRMTQLSGNPPVGYLSPARETAASWLRPLIDTALFMVWLYVLALIALAASAWRRSVHPLFWPVLLSALLYAGPLIWIAVSAEFRYLLWTVLAVPVCLALRLNVAVLGMPEPTQTSDSMRRVPD